MSKCSKERVRNLIIKIVKHFLESEKLFEEIETGIQEFTLNVEDEKEFLKNNFFFKEYDYKYCKDQIFMQIDDRIEFNPKIKGEIIKIVKKHFEFTKININEKVEEYKRKFEELKHEIMNVNNVEKGEKKFEVMINELKQIAVQLHWYYLPIYSEIILKNRGVLPEDDPKEYYNHYHTLEDLFFEIDGQGIDYKSLEGDCNLNKKIEIKIFTRRWGHEDIYIFKRTIEGWEVSFMGERKECDRNGEGGFFDFLKKDFVFFPEEGVKHAVKILWEEADKTKMSIEELQRKLQEIADWISDVEKNVVKKQPYWVNFY